MKKIRVIETELIQLVKKIIKEDAQNAYFTQKVTGQEMPPDAHDMAPDGTDVDSLRYKTQEKQTTERRETKNKETQTTMKKPHHSKMYSRS